MNEKRLALPKEIEPMVKWGSEKAKLIAEWLGKLAGFTAERLEAGLERITLRAKRIKEKKLRKAAIREKEKREKELLNTFRQKLYSPVMRRLGLFSIIYWVGGIFAINEVNIAQFLEDLARAVFLDLLSASFLYDLFYYETLLALLLIYCIICAVVLIRAFSRTMGYLDAAYIASGRLLDIDSDIGRLPTPINEFEQRLKNVKLSMERSEQLAKEADQRKNDLVVYLAHDLKTPLASVIGYLTLLEEAPDLPIEQRVKYTGITLNKAYRLEQLINEFFDITRFSLQSVELENNRIDFSFMLAQIVDEFHPMLEEKNLSIYSDIEPKLLLYGDADKLMRVFDNLLKNAVNYSYESTEISVCAWSHGDKIVAAVRNCGDEIPEHKLEQLFEKFFRADSARRTATGGSGLGLAIAKQIVELHNGEIFAQSGRNLTEFRVILPSNIESDEEEEEIVRNS